MIANKESKKDKLDLDTADYVTIISSLVLFLQYLGLIVGGSIDFGAWGEWLVWLTTLSNFVDFGAVSFNISMTVIILAAVVTYPLAIIRVYHVSLLMGVGRWQTFDFGIKELRILIAMGVLLIILLIATVTLFLIDQTNIGIVVLFVIAYGILGIFEFVLRRGLLKVYTGRRLIKVLLLLLYVPIASLLSSYIVIFSLSENGSEERGLALTGIIVLSILLFYLVLYELQCIMVLREDWMGIRYRKRARVIMDEVSDVEKRNELFKIEEKKWSNSCSGKVLFVYRKLPFVFFSFDGQIALQTDIAENYDISPDKWLIAILLLFEPLSMAFIGGILGDSDFQARFLSDNNIDADQFSLIGFACILGFVFLVLAFVRPFTSSKISTLETVPRLSNISLVVLSLLSNEISSLALQLVLFLVISLPTFIFWLRILNPTQMVREFISQAKDFKNDFEEIAVLVNWNDADRANSEKIRDLHESSPINQEVWEKLKIQTMVHILCAIPQKDDITLFSEDSCILNKYNEVIVQNGASSLASLEKMEVFPQEIEDKFASTMKKKAFLTHLKQLQTLTVANTEVSVEELHILFELVDQHPTLNELVFNFAHINIQALCEVISSDLNLTSLKLLKNTELGYEGVDLIIKSLTGNTKLAYLDLTASMSELLSEEAINVVASSNTLTLLDLSRNELDSQACDPLLEAFNEQTSLEVLIINENHVSEFSPEALDGLVRSNLKQFHVGENTLTIKALIDILELCGQPEVSLTRLGFFRQRVEHSEEEAALVVDLLQKIVEDKPQFTFLLNSGRNTSEILLEGVTIDNLQVLLKNHLE